MENKKVVIYDIMACNVYWDFDDSPLQNEQHKFLVSFYPTPGVPTPDLIKSIKAYGPSGYSVQLSQKMFTVINKNGWIYDPTLDYYWYMVNMHVGYMKEGEYTIEVMCKDGSVVKKSRVQKNAPGKKAIAAYLKNKDKMLKSYKPSRVNPFPAGGVLKDMKMSWSTLKDLAGIDAYYVTRLNEGSSSMQADVQKLIWWDNIYIQRVYNKDPKAGQNRSEVTVTTQLKPKTDYCYFVEITDSNVQSDANYCIFQPHQIFTTPRL